MPQRDTKAKELSRRHKKTGPKKQRKSKLQNLRCCVTTSHLCFYHNCTVFFWSNFFTLFTFPSNSVLLWNYITYQFFPQCCAPTCRICIRIVFVSGPVCTRLSDEWSAHCLFGNNRRQRNMAIEGDDHLITCWDSWPEYHFLIVEDFESESKFKFKNPKTYQMLLFTDCGLSE